MDFILSPLGKLLGGLALLVALYFGVLAYGAHRESLGETAERLKWEAVAKAERDKQAAVRNAVEQLGDRVVAGIQKQLAALPEATKEALDAAKEEDAKPVPAGCDGVYRGLPPGVLRGLDAIR